jgi:hypothetical protein
MVVDDVLDDGDAAAVALAGGLVVGSNSFRTTSWSITTLQLMPPSSV